MQGWGKRFVDVSGSVIGLLLGLPFVVTASLAIYLYDRKSPFYISPRVAKEGKSFNYIKLRSMSFNNDADLVDTTSGNDPRLTSVGRVVRALKIDEIPGLWNVLQGDMSLVGPRPNVKSATILYTEEECKLLSVKPGMTDLSSIIFFDQSKLLEKFDEPFLPYNRLIRPWKSRFGLFYINNQSLRLDLGILLITLVALFSHGAAVSLAARIVENLRGSPELCRIAGRRTELFPTPPPGATEPVRDRRHAIEISANPL